MDMDAFMAQAQEIQNRVAAAQEILGETIVRGIAANGGVIVTMTGKYDLVDVRINDDVAAMGGAHASEIVAAAFRDAKNKADAAIDKIMGDATAGMPMPE